MEKCFLTKDLNPATCRFVNKCKEGEERMPNFTCKKIIKKKNKTLVSFRKKKPVNSYELLLKTMKKSPDVKQISNLKQSSNVKMMTNILENNSYSLIHEKSPLSNEAFMKQSLMKPSVSEETYKRVFPENSSESLEDQKKYIVFGEGAGIMLADNLYKEGNMIELSKPLLKRFLSPPSGWLLSEKYDGLRCIWTGRELIARPSKRGGMLKGKVFSYVPKWFINLLPKGCSLDGELWLGRGRFQEISGLSNSKPNKKVTEEHLDQQWKEVKYMVFDMPHLKDLPYTLRLEELEKIVESIKISQADSPIKLTVVTKVNDHEHLLELYQQYTEGGAEGIIIREPSSFYETKRSKLLLKMKIGEDDEATVIDYDPGKGKYTGLLGALKCDYKGKPVHIGTGFSDLMRAEYNDVDSKHYIPIGATVNFSYMELTKDGIPRHPVYRGVRHDA